MQICQKKLYYKKCYYSKFYYLIKNILREFYLAKLQTDLLNLIFFWCKRFDNGCFRSIPEFYLK